MKRPVVEYAMNVTEKNRFRFNNLLDVLNNIVIISVVPDNKIF